jgi:adenylate cyclase
MFDFLGVADPDRPPPANPEARERQLLAAVRRWAQLGGQANRRVILIEDLHWLDPGSEVFIANVVEGLAHTDTLLIASFRPG